MNNKRFVVLLLALCLVFGLCACGSDSHTDETTAPVVTTLPVETTEATEAATPSHTAKVVDEGGNPIAGVFVQACLDTCVPVMTDENGVASWFDMADADYEVKLLTMPEGYTYSSEEQVFHFDSSNELTITLKAIA